jgi:hypothetical protein
MFHSPCNLFQISLLFVRYDKKGISILIDIDCIESLTSPENKSCDLPYNYPGANWPMHFCRRFSDTNYTCPIETGTGQCVIGEFLFAFYITSLS